MGTGESIVPGTFNVKKAGTREVVTDNGLGVFIDATDNVLATLDYNTGTITPSNAVDYTSTVSEDLGCVVFMSSSENQTYPTLINFIIHTSGTQRLQVDTVYLKFTLHDDSQFSVTANSAGMLSHANLLNGSVSTFGQVNISMKAGLKVKRIDYDFESSENEVAQADWYGFDVSLLNRSGAVPIFHKNTIISIAHSQQYVESTLTSDQVVSVLVEANYVDIMDNTGASLYSVTHDNYTYNKATGEITIKAAISEFTAPFIITAIQSERALIAKLEGNKLTTLTPLSRTYPAGSKVSSVYVVGDLASLAKNERTTSAWENDFDENSDGSGEPASGNINTVQYPIELTNIGAINQKWALVFTGSSTFKVIGETVGVIGSGDTLADLQPLNHLVGAPYFIIRQAAFGEGLNPGEAFLFETVAASKPIMLSRSVSPGHSNITNDQSTIAFFGNSD